MNYRYLLLCCFLLASFGVQASPVDTETLVSRLQSLRNTDPEFQKRNEWMELQADFQEALPQPSQKERSKFHFYQAVLFEEMGKRGNELGLLRDAAKAFLELSESFPNAELADDALYRSILLRRNVLREEEQAKLLTGVLFTKYPTSEYVYLLKGSLPAHVQPAPRKRAGLPLILLDPGHGGDDEGAVGVAGLREKDIVLAIAKLTKMVIEDTECCEVRLTREGDRFIPLFERTAMANQLGAALFVSIHINANATAPRKARGFEVYSVSSKANPEAVRLVSRENRAGGRAEGGSINQFLQDLYRRGSSRISSPFAHLVYDKMVRILPKKVDGTVLVGRGVHKAPFFVLFGAQMPAILVELFFVSHPEDAYLLSQPAFRKRIAAALGAGIVDYAKQVGQ